METMVTAMTTTHAMTAAMRWRATKRVMARAAREMRTAKEEGNGDGGKIGGDGDK
jgi:hypothetical protein